MTRVYLIRHAETARPDVFHGYESDTDLGPRGFRQAAALAPVVAALKPDVLVSSNMLRARRTADAIARAWHLPVRIEPQLHERKVGAMQGTPVHGHLGVWPDTLARWVAGETWYAPEGMESFDQIRARVLPVWDRVTSENPGKTLVIVAHGIVIRVILVSVLEGYNPADWPRLGRIANASVSEVIGSGRAWRAGRIGQVPDEVARAHDPEEMRPPPRPRRPVSRTRKTPANPRTVARRVRMKTSVRRDRYHWRLPLSRANSRAPETTPCPAPRC